MRGSSRRVLFLGLFALAGCADDAPPEDGGADAAVDAGDGAIDSAVPSIEITPSELPRMTPCPTGWREVVDADAPVTYCAPFPEGGPAACPRGQAHFPGGAGCETLGPPCPPPGSFAVDLPTDRTIVYVESGATGGDGTEGAPFGDIGSAVDAAPDGAIVAVAAGDYTEEIVLLRDLSIWGACTEGVVITGTHIGGVIQVIGADTELRNFTLDGAARGITANGSNTIVENVACIDVAGIALSSVGGSVSVRRMSVYSGETSISEGAFLLNDTTARLAEVAITGRISFPFSHMTGELEMTDSVIVDVTSNGTFPAVFIDTARQATLERVAVIRATPLGIHLQRNESFAMRDSYVEGATGSGGVPMGMIFAESEPADLARVTFVRPHDLALGLSQAPATVHASDIVILDAAPSELGDFGYGIGLVNGTSLTLERAYVARAWGAGIVVDGVGSELTATDLTVVGTLPNALGLLGRAIQAQTGATLVADRVHLSDNHEVTVVSANAGTELRLTEAQILSTAPRGCAPGCSAAGLGVGAYEEGHLVLDGFRLAGHALAGAQIARNGSLDLSRGEVSGNPVGVNIQVDAYDVDRLTEGVVYRDNGTNLDSDALPVPSASVSGL